MSTRIKECPTWKKLRACVCPWDKRREKKEVTGASRDSSMNGWITGCLEDFTIFESSSKAAIRLDLPALLRPMNATWGAGRSGKGDRS